MVAVNMIYARAANGVIGKEGTLPWHLPEDMAHFRQVTMGWPVIMGRKTWDSLPAKFRPLPGRTNIVITRQTEWQPEGAKVATSVEDAISLAGNIEEVWVIGGAQVYALAEPLADRLEVTEIAQDFEGDAYAPALGTQWVESARENHISKSGLAFTFITYNKQK